MLYRWSALVLFCLVALDIVIGATDGGLDAFDGAHCIALLFSLLAVGLSCYTKVHPRVVLGVWLVGLFGAVILADVEAAAELRIRRWPACLVLTQVAIVSRQRWFECGTVVVTVVYLVVERLEGALRFGLYAAATDDSIAELCDCRSPPCQQHVGESLQDAAVLLFVILFNMWLGRRAAAASDCRADELDKLRHALRVTERIAFLLSGSTTDLAAVHLSVNQSSLPQELFDALECLLCTLECTQEYLPDFFLADALNDIPDDGAGAAPQVPPPGAGADHTSVCVCFTDVESSTVLWEACPQAMYDALRLHNAVLRTVAAAEKGYEVKTIGDAFMLAFSAATDACRFALTAQERLCEEDWPLELGECELCARRSGTAETVLWNGLRVRIGMHCGPARVEVSPVTNRCDYFGTTVNIAARVESAVKRGGYVGVTAAVLDSVGADKLRELGSPVVHHLGPRQLKGVKHTVPISVLVPAALSQRVQEYREDSPSFAAAVSEWADRRRTRRSSGSSWRPLGRTPPMTRILSDPNLERGPSATRSLVFMPRQNSGRTLPENFRLPPALRSGRPDSLFSVQSFAVPPTSPQAVPTAPTSPTAHRSVADSVRLVSPSAPPPLSEMRIPTPSSGPSVGPILDTAGTELMVLPSAVYPVRGLTSPSSSRTRVSALGLPLSRSRRASLKSGTTLSSRLRLRQVTCAVARVRLEQAPKVETLSLFFSAIEGAADGSNGVVECVLSAGLVVIWNAQKPCADHVAGCKHFLQTYPRDPATSTATGAASGGVYSGSVSSGRRRFAVMVGSCVEVASELATEAEVCGEPVLAIGAVADRSRVDGVVRRAQLWETCTTFVAPSRTLVVWAVQLEAATGEYDKWGYLGDALETSDETPDEMQRVRMAVDASISDPISKLDQFFLRVAVLPSAEQVDILRRAAESEPGDAELADLLRRAERGGLKHRRRPAWIAEDADLCNSGEDVDASRRTPIRTTPTGSTPTGSTPQT